MSAETGKKVELSVREQAAVRDCGQVLQELDNEQRARVAKELMRLHPPPINPLWQMAMSK